MLLRYAYIVVLASLQLSCATLSQINLLSTQDEIEIGRRAAEEVEASMEMLGDREVNAYVQDLGSRLAQHAKRQDVAYSFKVVDTHDVNAFALPGGWMYVNAGLIAAAETESELAGVMAHEIGHVVGRHGARQISARYGLAVLLEIVAGGPNGDSVARQIAGEFAGLGAGLTLLKYGRDMEREADATAVADTHAAGIDPAGIAVFFEKLMAMQKSQARGVEALFATHPASQERIQNVMADVAKLPKKGNLRKDSRMFQRIRGKVRAYLKSKPKPEPEERQGVRRR